MFGPKVKLDPDLFRRAAEHARRRGYASLDEMVAHLLEGELRREEGGGESQEEMKKRLQGLGYIS